MSPYVMAMKVLEEAARAARGSDEAYLSANVLTCTFWRIFFRTHSIKNRFARTSWLTALPLLSKLVASPTHLFTSLRMRG